MSDQATQTCVIETGDFVSSALKGPTWTPYAEAIADHYPIQIPWYLSMQQTLTLSASPATQGPFSKSTRPQLYDVLILGMSALITGAVANDNGNYIYMQITDLQTGIPWVAPNMIGYAPVPAFAGLNAGPVTGTFFPTPVKKLPEAYFMPKGTRLRFDWFPIPESFIVTPNLNVVVTMVGVQLINHSTGFKAPETVTMPNGDVIPVGSRLPWLGCIPFGQRVATAASRTISAFTLPRGQQASQFLPAIDCNVELHDTYANFLAQGVTPVTDKNIFRFKLQDMRSQGDWTPELSPAPAGFGNEEQIQSSMPFVKPHLLRKGHRPAFVMLNNSPIDLTLNRGTVTIRGVRLCEY